MKNPHLTTALIGISYLGFSQTIPSGHFKISNSVKQFGINVSIGTEIYCLSDP